MCFKLFELDHLWSAKIAKVAFSPLGLRLRIRPICMAIEWIMHGIPWLIGSLVAIIWSRIDGRSWSNEQIHQLNILFISLLIDLIIVGVLKIIVRRERPEYNKDDQIYEAPIADKFSYPSGHSSRASMLFVLFPNQFYFWLPFVSLLAISRVLMGRHYISDIFAGLVIGKLEVTFTLALLPSHVNIVDKIFSFIL